MLKCQLIKNDINNMSAVCSAFPHEDKILYNMSLACARLYALPAMTRTFFFVCKKVKFYNTAEIISSVPLNKYDVLFIVFVNTPPADNKKIKVT